MGSVAEYQLIMEWRARESFHGQMAEGDLERMAEVAVEILGGSTTVNMRITDEQVADAVRWFRDG